MTTELALKESTDIVITGEQLDIIKHTICRDASEAEMQLFFYDCKRRGAHPLDRLIHFTKRGGRYTPITSIDFFYQRAHATEQFAGQDETLFKGNPGTAGFEATVRVYRQRPGFERAGWSATARWSEYYPGDAQGHMWKKMPNRMLEKCAEALALRKAFPAELQGLYVKEEMDQAGGEETHQKPMRAPMAAAPADKGGSVLARMQTNGRPAQHSTVQGDGLLVAPEGPPPSASTPPPVRQDAPAPQSPEPTAFVDPFKDTTKDTQKDAAEAKPERISTDKWAHILSYVRMHADLNDLRMDWEAKNRAKVKDFSNMNIAGQQAFLAVMRNQTTVEFPY